MNTTNTSAHLDLAWDAWTAQDWQRLGQALAAVGHLDPAILGRPATTQGQYWALLVSLVQHDAEKLAALGTLGTSLPTLQAAELIERLYARLTRTVQALSTPNLSPPSALAVCAGLLNELAALRQPQEVSR